MAGKAENVPWMTADGIVPLWWEDGALHLIDQRRLPGVIEVVRCTSHFDVEDAIKRMKVRGAPAIGVAAAYGMALAALNSSAASEAELMQDLERAASCLRATRPTAVNLFWAINRMLRAAGDSAGSGPDALKRRLVEEAHAIRSEDVQLNKRIGANGAELLKDGDAVLTHCNAGALATAGYGTALGVIRAAIALGKRLKVYADETRPFLQGMRLTAWELINEGINVTVICDNMAGYLMRRGEIHKVIVGADRIAANGDTANKIGTYSLAVLARAHAIPFYVAAPYSTLDLSLKSGEQIPIEERDPEEVTRVGETCLAPGGVKVLNPAFDVTPSELITAIITEKGVHRPPYQRSLAAAWEPPRDVSAPKSAGRAETSVPTGVSRTWKSG